MRGREAVDEPGELGEDFSSMPRRRLIGGEVLVVVVIIVVVVVVLSGEG